VSTSQGRSPAPILLVAHLVAAVGGLGTVLALVVLGLWGASGAEPATVYPAMYVIESRLLRPLAVLALVTGVAIALTSGWGLLRHRWVTVKLGVTALAAMAVIFVLTPSLGQAAEAALAQDPGQVVGEGRRLGYAVVPATAALILVVNAVLGVSKPNLRISRRLRRQLARRVSSRPDL
jgi:hypothetical protein